MNVFEIVLVPAASADPAARTEVVVFDELFHVGHHLGERSGVFVEFRHTQGLAEVEQVHMGIVEAGADEGALQVDLFAVLHIGGLIVKDVGEVIQRNELLRNIQEDLMVSGKENILCLTTGPNDTPEMKALKGAINAKQIDKKLYEDRFAQFQNNMRLLKGSSITLSKMIEICNGFDIACELTLRDKDGAVNPMNTEISLDLTEGRPIKN